MPMIAGARSAWLSACMGDTRGSAARSRSSARYCRSTQSSCPTKNPSVLESTPPESTPPESTPPESTPPESIPPDSTPATASPAARSTAALPQPGTSRLTPTGLRDAVRHWRRHSIQWSLVRGPISGGWARVMLSTCRVLRTDGTAGPWFRRSDVHGLFPGGSTAAHPTWPDGYQTVGTDLFRKDTLVCLLSAVADSSSSVLPLRPHRCFPPALPARPPLRATTARGPSVTLSMSSC